MTGKLILSWLALALLLTGAGGPVAAGQITVADLQAAGRLQAAAELKPTGNIVPGQKVTLTLTVATDRWFAGGTRIAIPEVPGLVLLQTDQFAANASENRQGVSWVVQRWTLEVYPQRAGDFRIPPIMITVKVNAGDDGDVEGELTSPAVALAVTIPEALAQAGQWVAAPAFTVSQSFDRPPETLEVGEAFEREIRFEASDVMAMMLPAVSPEQLAGLAAYPSPPVLDNSTNRGQTRATRVQRISYVAEADGRYQLPALEYFWWDTATAKLQLLGLPAVDITVGSGIAAVTGETSNKPRLSPAELAVLGGGLLLLLGLGLLIWRLLPRLPMQRIRSTLKVWGTGLQNLRKPALPGQLNPDSTAGD
jgi:hypothetical protein